MEPVNPERDGIPNYKRIVTNPMDLGTLMNRLYLDYYKSPQQFWLDLGLVFRNCRLFFKDPDCDIRILCDTLCEVAICLYKQWHALYTNKYEALNQDYQEKQKQMEEFEQEEEFQEKELIKKQTEEELKRRGDELHNFIHQFEKFQTQEVNSSQNGINRTSQEQIFKTQLAQFITNNPIICSQTLNLDEILRNVSDPNVNFDTLLQQVEPSCRQHILANLQKSQSKSFSPFMNQFSTDQNQSNLDLKLENSLKVDEKTNVTVNPNPQPPIQEPIQKKKPISKPKQESSYPLMKELELNNPGPYDFIWLTGSQPPQDFNPDVYNFLGEEELKELDLNKESDKLFMVKWKNLSYLEATWEHESILGFANKINDFKIFNRSLDKESRTQMLNKVFPI